MTFKLIKFTDVLKIGEEAAAMSDQVKDKTPKKGKKTSKESSGGSREVAVKMENTYQLGETTLDIDLYFYHHHHLHH